MDKYMTNRDVFVGRLFVRADPPSFSIGSPFASIDKLLPSMNRLEITTNSEPSSSSSRGTCHRYFGHDSHEPGRVGQFAMAFLVQSFAQKAFFGGLHIMTSRHLVGARQLGTAQ